MKDFQYDQLLTKNYILGKLLKGNFVGTFTTVFRKSVVEKVGTFKPELRQCEDYDYWLRCAMVTPVYVSSKPLVKRRIHSSNLTNNFLICSQFHEQVFISFYAKNRAFLMEQGLAPDVKAGLARVNYMVGNLQFEQGQTAAAFRTYLRAFKSNPDIHNFGLFTGAVFRKTCRILSLGLISR